jgi:epsilon-lactone hydrolase
MTETIVNANFHYHEEHLLDRAAMFAMRALLAMQPAADFGPGGRAAFDSLMEKTPSADGVTYEAAQFGEVHGWWCHPAVAMLKAAILYLHGGAYVVGSSLAYRNFAGQIAARAGAAVFIAEYGLAPERPFPAAVEDAEIVYRGLAAAGYGTLAVVGDSAGGGLALVTSARMAAAAHDGSLPSPVAVVAMSPWTDLALAGDSISARARHDPLLTADALGAARNLYLRSTDAHDPRASPLFGEMTNLPPVMLHVGEDEILLDDSRHYADSMKKSGGIVAVHVWQGMVHVFPANVSLLRAARSALDMIGGFLRQHLGADHDTSAR